MFIRRRHGRCLILLYYTLRTTFSPGMILLFYLISSRSLATNLSLSSAALLSRHGGISLHLWTSPNPNKVILLNSYLVHPALRYAYISTRCQAIRPYSYKKRRAALTTDALPRAFVLGRNLISWSAKKQPPYSPLNL